jgi:DNA-binding NarL/FixJ family response regulator
LEAGCIGDVDPKRVQSHRCSKFPRVAEQHSRRFAQRGLFAAGEFRRCDELRNRLSRKAYPQSSERMCESPRILNLLSRTPNLPVVRIVVVDDHAIVRECVRALLDRQNDMTVIGLAATGEQAILVAERLRPDLVIMDLALPGLNGTEATLLILGLLPRAHVIVLSSSGIAASVHLALQAGAKGYVIKEAVGRELASAVRTVMAGKRYLSPQIKGTFDECKRAAEDSRTLWEDLSSREREVLRRTADGASTLQIAELLSLSPKTIHTYRSRLMRKLGLPNRSTLIRYAMQHS